MRAAGLVLVSTLLSAPCTALADTPPRFAERAPDVAAQRAAMAKLGWLLGQWEGRGWVDTPEGRQTFRQTEHVEPRLDGALVVIEGRGYSGAPEVLAFHAFAVVSHNDLTGKYRFRGHSRGYATDAEAEVTPAGDFIWRMTPPGMTIRYTITQPRPGVWFEVGERSVDSGVTWTQFFEMELSRTSFSPP